MHTTLSMALPSTAHAEVQRFVFISDTQYPWTENSDSGSPEDAEETKSRSRTFIMDQGLGAKAYRQAHGGLDAVPLFLNGDVTAFGHGWQRKFMFGKPFEQAYVRNYHWLLGNHDYQNNVDDCASNGCAADMITAMIGDVDGYPYRFFDHAVRDNGWALHSGSLAYSILFGNVLAIQLQNEPTYTTRFESHRRTFTITSSLDLLERELKWARVAGKAVILNMHKAPFDHWKSPMDQRFLRLMWENEDIILGIFAGHLHRQLGRVRSIGNIPVYLSGAAHYGTGLTAEYDSLKRTLTVKEIRGNAWHAEGTVVGVTQRTGADAGAVPDIRDYPRHGWGSWGDIAMCPEGKFMGGFEMKSEGRQGNGDDSAANAVRFWCTPPDRWDPSSIQSKEGKWGEWSTNKRCADKTLIDGLQMRIEAEQGSGDDTGLNNIRVHCSDGKVVEGTPPVQWGDWHDMHYCPQGMAAAGFVTKVEDDQGGRDDSALNRIQLFCRPLSQ